jgi:uncharacterized membrane protein
MKKISVVIQSLFYLFGGFNHFINPEFYLNLIPPSFNYLELINVLAGIIEIGLGIGLLIPYCRKWAAFGIMLMLIAFIPSHVYFISIGGCVEEGLCVPMWIAWFRLLIIHPALVYWAWSASR